MAKRRLHGLQRVLGVNALFSTAYGNVGSSIYYALGLVASFVPHYVGGLFWEPLRSSPADIIAGIGVVVALSAINVRGVKESAGVNVGLAVADFCTQLLLVALGAFLVLSPHTLVHNVELG